MLLLAVGFFLTANGANTISITGGEGHPGDVVTVNVSLENSDAVTGVDMTIPLDNQMTYVDGSCVFNEERSNGHYLSVGLTDAGLRVVVFDFNGNALTGIDGELFSFKVQLKKEPQTYPLTAYVVASDTNGSSVPMNLVEGAVTILSPELTVITTSTDYGHIPIRSVYSRNITLQNSGNELLEITGMEFSAEEFNTEETAFLIEAGATKNVTINYAPVMRGAISETVTFISNAINGKQKAILVADPFSVNELHVGTASGNCDDEVTITLMMNNMEPITAVQCEFILPDQLEYVNDSFVALERANKLSVSSVVDGKKLSLMMYNTSGEVIDGDNGEIASFKLKLIGTSGTYYLSPKNVLLANVTAENMTSATKNGSVTIKSAKLQSAATLNMGDCAVTEMSTAKYAIKNIGKVPLIIEHVTFLANDYSVVEQLPIIVDVNKSTEITVQYKPSISGEHSATMNVYTNDPLNRMKVVTVNGNIYEPNNVSLGGEYTENGYDLKVGLKNYTDIVAVQMDIHWIEGMTADNIIASDRLNGLMPSITDMGNGIYKVIIFSLNNTPILGNEGDLFSISYCNDADLELYNTAITIDNIVLSNVKGENMSSQNEFVYTVPARLAESITLDKTETCVTVGETTTIIATVLPETTTLKDIVWTSSDESVATVEDGIVSSHQCGSVTITARTTDGSNLSASCMVTVEISTVIENIRAEMNNSIYYTLDGIQVYKENLTPGVYIKNTAKIIEKVIVK